LLVQPFRVPGGVGFAGAGAQELVAQQRHLFEDRAGPRMDGEGLALDSLGLVVAGRRLLGRLVMRDLPAVAIPPHLFALVDRGGQALVTATDLTEIRHQRAQAVGRRAALRLGVRGAGPVLLLDGFAVQVDQVRQRSVQPRFRADSLRYLRRVAGMVARDLAKQDTLPHRMAQRPAAEVPAAEPIEFRRRHHRPGEARIGQHHGGAHHHCFQGTAALGEHQVVLTQQLAGLGNAGAGALPDHVQRQARGFAR